MPALTLPVIGFCSPSGAVGQPVVARTRLVALPEEPDVSPYHVPGGSLRPGRLKSSALALEAGSEVEASSAIAGAMASRQVSSKQVVFMPGLVLLSGRVSPVARRN